MFVHHRLCNILTLCMLQARKVDNTEIPQPTTGEKSRQKNHQPVSEGISWEARIISSHTAAQKIARKLSFQVTKNDMMVAEQVWT